MGRPSHLNGGRKQVFPVSQRDLIEDLKAISYQIEELEAEIDRLTSKRDKLQVEGYRLQDELYAQALSHAVAISGQAGPLCRAYAAMAAQATAAPVPAGV